MPGNIEVGRDAEAHLPAVRYHEGLAFEALDRSEDAAQAFHWTAHARVAARSDHHWVGQSLEKLGRPDEARSHFEELAGTVPPVVDETAAFEARMRTLEERADGFYLAALGLYGLGREDEARRSLGEALATDPSHLGATQLRRSWEVEP